MNKKKNPPKRKIWNKETPFRPLKLLNSEVKSIFILL